MSAVLYLVVGSDVPGQNREVVEAQRHVVVHVLVQPLIGGVGVAMETETERSDTTQTTPRRTMA